MLFLLTGLAFAAAMQGAQQMGRISGVVIDSATMAPVAGAQVFVTSPDDPPTNSLPDATTDADGRYTLQAVPAGRYYVGAHKEGFAPPMDPSLLSMVDLPGGQEITNVVVPMQRGGIITGRALDPSGQPMRGMSVTALVKRFETTGLLHSGPHVVAGAPVLMPFGQSETNERGEYRIEGLPSGDYLVASHLAAQHESKPASVTIGTTYYPGTTDESVAQAVPVQVGRTVDYITFRSVEVRTLRVMGVVVDDKDVPVANTMVMLIPDLWDGASFATGAHASTESDANGAFTLEGIPPGNYTVMIAEGMGGIGAFASSSVIISDTGMPIADKGPVSALPAPSRGAIAIAVKDADVTDVKLVMKHPE
jgi:5-hydroxyisourate hydrolase-like protein (transthyretin family)